jgi:hypothetical protein
MAAVQPARLPRTLVVGAALALSAGRVANAAPGQDERIDACLADHARAQLDREAGDLLGARTALQRCADAGCPELVRTDCGTWLGEVDTLLPTVAITVTLDGTPTAPDLLWIDDVAQPLDVGDGGWPVNPGVHRFRARAIVEGAPVELELERTISSGRVRQTVRLELRPAASRVAPTPKNAPTERPAPHRDHRTLRITGYALLGIGAAFGIVAAGVGASGLVAYHDAQDECAPFCSESSTRDIRARILTADIMVPIAAALVVGGAVVLALGHRKHASARARAQLDGLTLRF